MIIKLSFAGAVAAAAAASGSSGNTAVPGAGVNHSENAGLKVSVFRPGGEEPTIPKISNVIDSGIRKASEFFPEAA